MQAQYVEKFDPADEPESNLVDQMVTAVWRQYRIWAGEAALFDLKIRQQLLDASNQFPGIDSSGRFALAFKALADDSESLRLMQRYETNCRHQYDRALRNLLELRKPRPEPEPQYHPPTKVIFCGKKEKCDPNNPRPDCNFTHGPNSPSEPNPTSEQSETSNHEPTTTNQERKKENIPALPTLTPQRPAERQEVL